MVSIADEEDRNDSECVVGFAEIEGHLELGEDGQGRLVLDGLEHRGSWPPTPDGLGFTWHSPDGADPSGRGTARPRHGPPRPPGGRRAAAVDRRPALSPPPPGHVPPPPRAPRRPRAMRLPSPRAFHRHDPKARHVNPRRGASSARALRSRRSASPDFSPREPHAPAQDRRHRHHLGPQDPRLRRVGGDVRFLPAATSTPRPPPGWPVAAVPRPPDARAANRARWSPCASFRPRSTLAVETAARM